MKEADPHQLAQVNSPGVGFDLAILGRWAGVGVIVIAGVIMLVISWRKWLDPVVDYGREIYIPWQLSQGQVLYRDIAYFNGPLSPYFNALLLKIFGVGLMSLAWVNIAILAGLTFLIYRLLCLVGSRLGAVLGCVVFLVIFGLAQLTNTANYNFVCPYSHELTHGLALSLLAIYLLYRYLDSSKALFLGLAGVCLGLILLTKVEVFVAAVLALALGWVLILRQEKPRGLRLLKLLGFFVGGMTVPLACFGAYFTVQMPIGQAFGSIFASYGGLVSLNISEHKFYRVMMGFDQPGHNLLLMLKVTGWYLLLLGPLAVADYLLRRFKAHRKYISPAVFALGLGFSIWVLWARNWSGLLGPLPLFMVILTGGLLLALVRCRADVAKRNRYGLALVLSVFSLVLLAKIVLNARVYHYGFVLAAPATLLLIVALVHWLPRLLGGKSKQGGWVFRPVILAVLIVGLAWHFNITRQVYADKTHQLGKGPDAFVVRSSTKAPILSQTLEFIGKMMGPDETFVVFPEGVMLNYLSRRLNPTKYVSFMPAELGLFGEKSMLAALGENPPDHVLILSRNMREYGYSSFGVDYCMEIAGWINDNYGEFKQLGLSPTKKQKIAYKVLYGSRTAESNPNE